MKYQYINIDFCDVFERNKVHIPMSYSETYLHTPTEGWHQRLRSMKAYLYALTKFNFIPNFQSYTDISVFVLIKRSCNFSCSNIMEGSF